MTFGIVTAQRANLFAPISASYYSFCMDAVARSGCCNEGTKNWTGVFWEVKQQKTHLI